MTKKHNKTHKPSEEKEKLFSAVEEKPSEEVEVSPVAEVEVTKPVKVKVAAKPSQALTANGEADGTLLVADTSVFKIGDKAVVSSKVAASLEVLIVEIPSLTLLKVKQQPNGTLDMRSFLVFDEAKVEAL